MIKKNLLAIAVLLFSIVFISNNSFSQVKDTKSKKTPEEMATKMADKMKKNLSLSDEQYKQVYNLFLSKAQEKQNNKEKYMNMDKNTRKQMMKQNKSDFKKQLEGILNKDQIQKLQGMKEKHKHSKSEKKHKKEQQNN